MTTLGAEKDELKPQRGEMVREEMEERRGGEIKESTDLASALSPVYIFSQTPLLIRVLFVMASMQHCDGLPCDVGSFYTISNLLAKLAINQPK